jgi:hypothetical protein
VTGRLPSAGIGRRLGAANSEPALGLSDTELSHYQPVSTPRTTHRASLY